MKRTINSHEAQITLLNKNAMTHTVHAIC